MKLRLEFSIFLLYLWTAANASADPRLNQIQVKVSGTSTLHNWDMKSQNVRLNMKSEQWNPDPVKIRDIIFNIPSKSLKSGKSGMDDKAYEALKADQFPEIKFRLVKVELKDGSCKINGNLEIAGSQKEINFIGTATATDGGGWKFRLESAIRFSDFKLQPPVAMFGTIKTGNDLKIQFSGQILP